MIYTNKSCIYHGDRVPFVRVAFYPEHATLTQDVDHEEAQGTSFCVLCLRTFATQFWVEDNLPEGAEQLAQAARGLGKSFYDPELLRRASAYSLLGCHNAPGGIDE